MRTLLCWWRARSMKAYLGNCLNGQQDQNAGVCSTSSSPILQCMLEGIPSMIKNGWSAFFNILLEAPEAKTFAKKINLMKVPTRNRKPLAKNGFRGIFPSNWMWVPFVPYFRLARGSLGQIHIRNTWVRWVTIPHICHFFTQVKFLENKIYTEKQVNCQFFALNL